MNPKSEACLFNALAKNKQEGKIKELSKLPFMSEEAARRILEQEDQEAKTQ